MNECMHVFHPQLLMEHGWFLLVEEPRECSNHNLQVDAGTQAWQGSFVSGIAHRFKFCVQ